MGEKKVTKKKTSTKSTSKKKVSKKKKIAKKSTKKVNKKVSKKNNNSNDTTEKNNVDDADEEIVLPKLDGKNLKKEIEELEKADSGKKEPPKKNSRGGSRKTKSKRVITATKAGPGLRFAPGVKISGNKKNSDHKSDSSTSTPKEFRRLTPEELEETRKKLIDMRENILENMRKEIADYRLRASSSSADLVDQAADAYDDNVSFEIAANSDQELEQIDSALEKIEKGTYGLCEMCSVTISPSRLKILPFATRCVNCRSNYEQTKIKKDKNNSWNFPDGSDSNDNS